MQRAYQEQPQPLGHLTLQPDPALHSNPSRLAALAALIRAVGPAALQARPSGFAVAEGQQARCEAGLTLTCHPRLLEVARLSGAHKVCMVVCMLRSCSIWVVVRQRVLVLLLRAAAVIGPVQAAHKGFAHARTGAQGDHVRKAVGAAAMCSVTVSCSRMKGVCWGGGCSVASGCMRALGLVRICAGCRVPVMWWW